MRICSTVATLTLGALLTTPYVSGAAAAGPTPSSVTVTINDKGCQPMQLTVPAEKVNFKIKNESRRALEWEILKDGVIIEEREKILPGFTSSLSAKLDPASYEMTCGLLSNPKGKLTVAGTEEKTTTATTKAHALQPVIDDYKAYVSDQVDTLAAKTQVLVDAVKAGKLEEAQQSYAPARIHYERIEPVAEVFSDLDKSMDARADDYEKKEADPTFSGFHRLEYGLFEKKSTDGLAPYADQLMKDVHELKQRVAKIEITPKILVGGAAELIEEVASKKISGEEDRYAKTDLWDFQANVDGAQKIVALLKPHLESHDPALLKRVEANFAKVDRGLAKYKLDRGFESYDRLKPEDQRALKGPITVLAEDLSMLRGTLGVD